MEYTESLPLPPGTQEAWPTKPRSVSHWPGLGGLGAGRLSAGQPGPLRTLVKRASLPVCLSVGSDCPKCSCFLSQLKFRDDDYHVSSSPLV